MIDFGVHGVVSCDVELDLDLELRVEVRDLEEREIERSRDQINNILEKNTGAN